MDLTQHSAYRVPTKRPFLLAEMRRQLPSVDQLISNTSGCGDPTEYEAVADALYRLFVAARNLAPSRSTTDCSIHPNGPVDPEPPQGWGTCLFCNSNRRVGNPRARQGPASQRNSYDIPPPPYRHEGLVERMWLINDRIHELHYRSADSDFAEVADLVHGAFIMARELSRPRLASRCPRHPGAPLDPAAAGGPRCLFCVADDRRAGRTTAIPPPQLRDRPRRPGYRPRPPS